MKKTQNTTNPQDVDSSEFRQKKCGNELKPANNILEAIQQWKVRG